MEDIKVIINHDVHLTNDDMSFCQARMFCPTSPVNLRCQSQVKFYNQEDSMICLVVIRMMMIMMMMRSGSRP